MPEKWEYDNYVGTDLKENMENYFGKDQDGWQIVVPNIFFRYHFIQRTKRYAEKGKDYLTTKSWKRIHKRLNGSFYLIGEIRFRKTKGKEHIGFMRMRMAVAHRKELPESQRSYLRFEMERNSESEFYLDREYEVEKLDRLSKEYVFIIEFIIGLSRYLSGDFLTAYNLHGRIVEQKRVVSRNPQLNIDAANYLGKELSAIIYSYLRVREFSDALAFQKRHKQKFGESISVTIMDVHLLIAMSTSISECQRNARIALQLYNDLSIEDVSVRAVVLLNKAYLCLLIEQYDEADRYYHDELKYSDAGAYQSIIRYCSDTLKDDNRSHEFVAARYAKAYAYFRLRDYDALKRALVEVEEYCMEDTFYLKKAQLMRKSIEII